MADRITQLQDIVCSQAYLFLNSITYINECSNPAEFPKVRKHDSKKFDDKCLYFARESTKIAKDIDEVIASLPDDISTSQLQNKSMERLQNENDEITNIFETIIAQGESLLHQIQGLLVQIDEQVMAINEIGQPPKM